MSLPHALLTALIEMPCSGLELSRRFDRSIGYYWRATHQQIYRELARLETAGWVEGSSVKQSRGSKKEYRVLAAGRRELRRWGSESHDPPPMREELLIRLRAEAVLGTNSMAPEIERLLTMHQARLATFQKLEKERFSDSHPSRSTAILHLTLKTGILSELMWINWSNEALRVLKATYPKT